MRIDQWLWFRRLKRGFSRLHALRSEPMTVRGRKAALAAMQRSVFEFRSFHAAVSGLAAPSQWRGLRKQWLKVAVADQRFLEKAYASAKKSKHPVRAWNSTTLVGIDRTDIRKLDARFNDAGLTSCAFNRSK